MVIIAWFYNSLSSKTLKQYLLNFVANQINPSKFKSWPGINGQRMKGNCWMTWKYDLWMAQCSRFKEAFQFWEQAIVFQGEVFSIFQVTTKEKVKNDCKQEIHINSDSQAALKFILRLKASLTVRPGTYVKKQVSQHLINWIWERTNLKWRQMINDLIHNPSSSEGVGLLIKKRTSAKGHDRSYKGHL